MKTSLLGLVIVAVLLVTGCGHSHTITEGTILSVEYQMGDGRAGGFTV
jgi:major membrane immunogen (membrane-anchored lipoprotein)